MFIRLFLVLVFVSSIIYAISLPSTKAFGTTPNIYPINSAPYGIPYSQWIARWWQWSYSIPTSEHPRQNYTPEKCTMGQHGPVWFLADSLSGTEVRTCTIPAGKSILAAVLTGECDRSDPSLQNDQDIRQCATEGNDYGIIHASLDNSNIQTLERADSGYYNLTIPADNIYKEKPGTYRAFTNGYFVFLHPLPSGTHDLHFDVSVENPIKPVYNYAAVWTYHLIVMP